MYTNSFFFYYRNLLTEFTLSFVAPLERAFFLRGVANNAYFFCVPV